jgi:hypothetical protein
MIEQQQKEDGMSDHERMVKMLTDERNREAAEKAEISARIKSSGTSGYQQNHKNKLPKTTAGWMREMERTEKY